MPKATVEKTAPVSQPLTSLSEIQKLCAQTKRVEFTLDGKKCALEVRRLTPAEEARLAEIADSVTPPIIKGANPEQDRLDLTNAAYLKKKTEAALQARSQGLYWAIPAFQADKPNLTNLADIEKYIQGQLSEQLLDVLWKASRESGIAQADLVNFT